MIKLNAAALVWTVLCPAVTWQQFAAGHGCCSVALILYKGEASVLRFVGGAWIHDDVHHTICDLLHL